MNAIVKKTKETSAARRKRLAGIRRTKELAACMKVILPLKLAAVLPHAVEDEISRMKALHTLKDSKLPPDIQDLLQLIITFETRHYGGTTNQQLLKARDLHNLRRMIKVCGTLVDPVTRPGWHPLA